MAPKKKRKKRRSTRITPGLLTQTAEYALRAMAYLATRPNDVAVPARELAETTGIPPHYLSKVMRQLTVARLVTARKGHGGGFRLRCAPDRISVAEVLSAVDFSIPADRCAYGWGDCDAERPCPLHGMWSRLIEQHRAWASGHTLADAGAWPDEPRE